MSQQIDKPNFARIITHISNFFGTFKLKAEQIDEWYSRLKFFSYDELKLASDNYINKNKYAPSFADLLQFSYEARKELKAKQRRESKLDLTLFNPSNPEGFAPMSDQKTNLIKKYTKLLYEAFSKKDIQKLNLLKENWKHEYQLLPGYKNSYEITKIVQQNNLFKMKELGITTS